MVGMRDKWRPQFSPEDQAQVLKAFARSGLSPAQFARQEGIGRSTLYRWLGRRALPTPLAESTLVEVPNLLSAQGKQPFQVRFPNGVVLELAGGFALAEASQLAQLLHGL